MAKNENSSNWLDRLMNNGMALLILGVFMIGLFVAGAWYLDNRIAGLESNRANVPPPSYSPPDLDNFDPGNVSVDDLNQPHLVYVPVYSHIYSEGGRPYPLETMLSIRNVSIARPIYLNSVKYYDTEGKLAATKLDRLIKLAPLQTIEFLVERRDSTGGSGANFLVQWLSDSDLDEPIIETMMVGTTGTQGISFSRTGVEVKKHQ